MRSLLWWPLRERRFQSVLEAVPSRDRDTLEVVP